MANETQQLPSWRVMLIIRRELGIKATAALLGVSERTVYDQSADPSCTVRRTADSNSRPSIKRWRDVCTALVGRGADQYARLVMNYIGSSLNDVECGNGAMEPLSNMDKEKCADFPAVVRLHEAIDSEAPIEEVERLLQELKDEAERTVILYRKQCGE